MLAFDMQNGITAVGVSEVHALTLKRYIYHLLCLAVRVPREGMGEVTI